MGFRVIHHRVILLKAFQPFPLPGPELQHRGEGFLAPFGGKILAQQGEQLIYAGRPFIERVVVPQLVLAQLEHVFIKPGIRFRHQGYGVFHPGTVCHADPGTAPIEGRQQGHQDHHPEPGGTAAPEAEPEQFAPPEAPIPLHWGTSPDRERRKAVISSTSWGGRSRPSW